MEFKKIMVDDIEYEYLGLLMDASCGPNLNLPEENTKLAWYEKLTSDSDVDASASLAILYHDLKDLGENFVKENYSEFLEIIYSEELSNFTNKWFECNGSIFKEPIFLDGTYGTYSVYGSEKLDEELQEAITDNILIDVTKSNEFREELKGLIELFKVDL